MCICQLIKKTAEMQLDSDGWKLKGLGWAKQVKLRSNLLQALIQSLIALGSQNRGTLISESTALHLEVLVENRGEVDKG